jgi:hypothetical protein
MVYYWPVKAIGSGGLVAFEQFTGGKLQATPFQIEKTLKAKTR